MPHLHQDERDYRGQHETGKAQQENAVHGKQRGRQHHQKCDDREKVIVAVPLRRKQPHHHDEQNQVDGRVEKSAGEQK